MNDGLTCLECGNNNFKIAKSGHKPLICLNCHNRFSIVGKMENKTILDTNLRNETKTEKAKVITYILSRDNIIRVV